MSEDELEQIQLKIECEGFDYALVYYSDWKEIRDKEFQRLRKVFVKAREELAKYLDHEYE